MLEMTAGELTTEHYGLLITFQPKARADGFLPLRKTVVCDELRRWVCDGQRHVGMTDFTPQGGFVGAEHHLLAETTVQVGDRARNARKRPWGVGALKPGEQCSALTFEAESTTDVEAHHD